MSIDDTTTNNESFRQQELEAKFEARKKEFEDKRRGGGDNKKDNEEEDQKQTSLIPKLREADDPEEDTGVIFDKKKFPRVSQAEYDRYWEHIGAQRSAYLTKLAQQSNFIIPLYSNINPDLDDTDKDLEDASTAEISIDQKEFKFHDVTTVQWERIQELDTDIAEARQRARDLAEAAVKQKTPIPKEELSALKDTLREKDRRKYRYSAKIFFRMTGSEIDRADQRRLKDAVDAAIHRTITTIPNSARTSNQPFM